MFVTFAVFHEPIEPLNAEANLNIAYMFVTFAVFHEPIEPLNAEAIWNIACMFVTLDGIVVGTLVKFTQ